MSGRKTLKRAFTLIELLVVVAIIALLISILLPSLARAREQAKQVVCASHLNALGKAMVYYADDNNGLMPNFSYKLTDAGAWHWTGALAKYIKIKRSRVGSKDGLYVCPSDDEPAYRYITSPLDSNGRPQVMPGTESTAFDKAQMDAGGSAGARPRGGRGGGGGSASGGLSPLIEPVSYQGTCDSLELKMFGGKNIESPRSLTGVKRPYCYAVLTETQAGTDGGDAARQRRCFRWKKLIEESRLNNNEAYRRHYGGKSAASNGTNFLFADSHAKWHSSKFLSDKLICCYDFGVPLGQRADVNHQAASGSIDFQIDNCNFGSSRTRGR